MFRTKKDTDRHVAEVLSKIDNENEKNLRGYTFARLYYQVMDYESAKKYVTSFLSVRDHYAPSYKLLAQIYEASNDFENALQSYKRSLEIDSNQNDIILKICELYCKISVDHETARYWADRAEQLFPHNNIVFKLRECLMSADGEPDREELENLIATELAAQPKNVDLRIKLLRLYLDTERIKEAYDHATMIESKQLFLHSKNWYYLLGDIFEAYQEEFNQELNCQFYINYLTALDHLVFLSNLEPHAFMSENGWTSSSIDDAAAVLLTFDQALKKASEIDTKEGSWVYFMNHMKGQLYFHMTSLLMKRAKHDQGNRKEAFRFSAALALVCYTFKPVNLLQEIWFSQMEDNQKLFTKFFLQDAARTSFIGHVIMSMCKEDKNAWLQKYKREVCISQVKERIYSRIFSSVVQKEKEKVSYFISDSTFEHCSLEFPSDSSLREYDKSAYKLYPDSLHHLVWLQLNGGSIKDAFDDNLAEVFKNLQYGNKNLSKGSCESLCVLDLEAFLYASVFQAHCLRIERKTMLKTKSQDLQLTYPPDIADPLCSKQQMTWWKSSYGLYTCTIKEKLSEHRKRLQQGLEVIRGVGNHGLNVYLIVHLAQVFANKAEVLMKNLEDSTNGKSKINIIPEKVDALHTRASHYWNIALGILHKLSSGQTPRVPQDPMFSGSERIPSNNEIKSFQEEGKLYLAVRYMDSEKLNEAAEILSKLSTPYGSFYLALTMKKLASQEAKTSSKRTAFLNKAKSSLHETMDRVKDDRSHPLNNELHTVLEEVENELSSDFKISNESSYEDGDEIDSYHEESFESLYITPKDRISNHSTPRPSAKFLNNKSKLQNSRQEAPRHFEPSPERLDAQIRALTLNQDSIVKSLMQQQQSLLETNKEIVETLKQNKDVLEKLKVQLEELSLSTIKQQTKCLRKKPPYGKGQGDEEEYDYDPNSLLEFYTDEAEDYRSGFSYDHSTRIVHDPAGAAASLNYVVPAALPPGPPPALNHYNYQYPPHAVLPPPPPAAVAERSAFYHPPGQGLPFSEGQQLPQFHFHVASPVVKPAPPIMSSVASVPSAVSAVSLPPVTLPPQTVIPSGPPIPVPSPWSKTVGVPHAFQIPLPSAVPFVSVSNITSQTSNPVSLVKTPVTPPSNLQNLLQRPIVVSASIGQSVSSATSTNAISSSSSMFAGLVKTPENSLLERSRCDSEKTGSPDDVEKEVMGDFKPLIPLPEEIVVETGEEDEVVLFEDRAKLYRFMEQEWKERGVGTVKILHHEGSGRVRLLMRRDQVLKVCANHYLTPEMEIHPLKNSDKAWTWLAQDFADEVLKPEHFCIRFKTADIALAFKSAFDKSLKLAKGAENKKSVFKASLSSTGLTNASPISQTSFGTTTSPISQTSFGTTTSPILQTSFGAKFLPKAGSWTCPTCYVSNTAEKLLCVACETKKPGSQNILTSSSLSVTTSNISVPADSKAFSELNKTQFSFGGVPLGDNSQISKLVTSSTNTTTSSFGTFTFASGFQVQDSNSSDSSVKNSFGGFTFTTDPTIKETDNSDSKDREILVVSTKSKNGPQVTKVNAAKNSPFSSFSFKSPDSTSVTSPNQFTFTSISKTSSTSKLDTINFPTSANITKIQNLVQNIEPENTLAAKTSTTTSSLLNSSESKFSVASGSPLTVKVTPEGRKVSLDGTDIAPEDFVPTAEFKPVVPLPALIDVKTGEEGEDIVFAERAKLYRYDTEAKEWKERGLGEIKILYLKDSKKYRILMRREQVLKICANHYILPDIKLTPLSQSDKTWAWFAQDFSDGDLKKEHFAVKFKNFDIAQQFYKIFTKCQAEINAHSEKNKVKDLCAENKTTFDQLFETSSNSWECSNCKKSNMNMSSCVYCKTPKPVKPLSELFKPDPGSWECEMCYVRNKSESEKCISCDSPNTSVTSKSTLLLQNSNVSSQSSGNLFSSSLSKKEPVDYQTDIWECKSCSMKNNFNEKNCISCKTAKPTDIAEQLTSVPVTTSASKPTFAFQMPKSNSEFVFGVRPTSTPSTFTFGLSSVSGNENRNFGLDSDRTSSNVSIFGGTSQKLDAPAKNPATIAETTAAPTYVFGNPNSSIISPPKFCFKSDSKKCDSGLVEFRFGSPQKYEFNFSGVKPRSPVKTPKSPRSPGTPSDVEDDEDDAECSDADIYFQPAIPLPPKVEVKTGEEDENVLFCQRAKLYRFSVKEWKERGIGDLKLLYDQVQKKVRLLMRREQVLKVCLNHYLTKELEFEWRGDKSLTWATTDFSENVPSPELFAVKFKTNELADQFKKSIDDAKKLLQQVESSKESPKISASNFSFKSDTPLKNESAFSTGVLSSRFSSTVPENSNHSKDEKAGAFSKSASNTFFSKVSEATKNAKTYSEFFHSQPKNNDSEEDDDDDSGTQFENHESGDDSGTQLENHESEDDSEPEIIYEVKPSDEQIALASRLQLPRSFYLYENKPPCTGCRGCDAEYTLKNGNNLKVFLHYIA